MPQIPVYNSNRNIEANISAPLRNEAAAPFENIQKVAGVMKEINQKWADASDLIDYTEAKGKYEVGVAQIEAEAAADPDFKNSDKYYKKLQDNKNASVSIIRNKANQQKIGMEMEFGNQISAMKIGQSFKQKQMLMNEINLEGVIRAQAEKKSVAGNDTIKKQADEETFDMIQKQVAAGLITPAKGKNLLDNYRLGSVDLDIMRDNAISKENSYVYSELVKGKDGIYPDLSDDERADRLEKTELHVRRNKYLNNYTSTKTQDENENNLLNNFGSPEITEGVVRNMLVSQGVRKTFGEKYIKAMYEVPAEKTDYQAYNRIKMLQLNTQKPEKVNGEILSKVSSLTIDDRNKLLKSSYDYLDKKTIDIKASAQALAGWATKELSGVEGSQDIAEEMVYNFFTQLDKNPNMDVDAVLSVVQKSYVRKLVPSTALLNDTPNIIANKNKMIKAYKKESKMGGKKADIKPVKSTVYQSSDIGYDDL